MRQRGVKFKMRTQPLPCYSVSMTSQELEALVDIILTGSPADAGDAATRLSDQSTSADIPRLHELTAHTDLLLSEMAACALANAAGPSALTHILQTLDRCTAEGMDCDSLVSTIICLVEENPDDALKVLKPFIQQRDHPHRMAAIWAVSHIDQTGADQLLNDIMNDASESEEVRTEVRSLF